MVDVTTAGLPSLRCDQRGQQTLDSLRHDDTIAGGSDQALQLRQLAAFGAEI